MLISSGLVSVKTLTVAVIGWAAAFVVGVVLQAQDNSWLQVVIPAIVSAVVPSTILLISKILELRREQQKSRDDREERGDDKHLSYSEKIAELTAAERAKLLEEKERNYQQKSDFLNYQLEIRVLQTFEARMRAHQWINEVTRCQGYIFQLHALMSQAGLNIPEFKIKTDEEIQLDIAEKVAAYKLKLEKDKEALIHLTD
jgi:hypothetical protein